MEAALRVHTCLWLLPACIPLLWPSGLAASGEPCGGTAPCPRERTWAVHLAAPSGAPEEELDRQAERLAREAGLVNMGRVGELRGHYLFGYRPAGQLEPGLEAAQHAAEAVFARHDSVRWHAEERLLKRSKRGLSFNDPKYPQQWHLVSTHTPPPGSCPVPQPASGQGCRKWCWALPVPAELPQGATRTLLPALGNGNKRSCASRKLP